MASVSAARKVRACGRRRSADAAHRWTHGRRDGLTAPASFGKCACNSPNRSTKACHGLRHGRRAADRISYQLHSGILSVLLLAGIPDWLAGSHLAAPTRLSGYSRRVLVAAAPGWRDVDDESRCDEPEEPERSSAAAPDGHRCGTRRGLPCGRCWARHRCRAVRAADHHDITIIQVV